MSMSEEEIERVRQIARAWMYYSYPKQLFIEDKAVQGVPLETRERIWNEEFQNRNMNHDEQ